MPQKVKKPSKTRLNTSSVSKTLLAFSEPLLDLYAKETEPPTRQAMEELLMIATTIWNAPVADAWSGGGTAVEEVEHLMTQLPAPISAAARAMARDRAGRCGAMKWASETCA